ncbi:multicopper oxidase family protein [Actinomadura sp. CNU-125]|uniref:multicopper oxidase family protein n=1 Tax=Actinomadura sp. CNU-125 TaxID=1904961 RepID=UPI0021CCC7BA|nr:multicopper oxidase family protein [Actinomadura sp. CNU-125]
MRETEAEILPGRRSRVLTYHGSFPGPTIRAKSGRRTVITQVNALSQDAVVHLHGGHVHPDHDGYPMDVIEPGAARTYRYPNRQPGATLWYHDHSHHTEAEMVFRGLSGAYLIEDPAERALRLPSGRHDVTLMMRDARFDDDGQLLFEMDDFRYRNTLLVNGRPQPFMEVSRRKYRLRLMNASNERYFKLGLDDGGELVQIASDGGLLPAPVPATSVELSPGERVDVVVDFGRYRVGTKIVLENTAFDSSEETRQVMRFDVVRGAADHSRVPDRLRPMHDLGPAAKEREVKFSLDMTIPAFVIDGKIFDHHRIDATVRRGETEIWTVRNEDPMGIPHNVHLHGTHFQVLERSDRPLEGHERGWKDTVGVPVGGHVRFRVRFDDYTGRYLYHCHLLDHSSMGMMAQLEVVE